MPFRDDPLTPRKLLTGWLPVGTLFVLGATGRFELWFGLDAAQGRALAILLVTAVLWVTELIPLFATSFLVLGLQVVWLLPAIQAKGGEAAAFGQEQLLQPFFSDIVLLFLGGFVLSAALSKFKLDARLAERILQRTGTRPSRVLLGIIVVAALLSMWMSNTATAAMMLAIILPIVLRVPEGHGFRIALLLSIPFACNIGGIATPIGSPPNAIAMRYLDDMGLGLSFAKWMLATLPLAVVLLVALWQLLLRLHPPGELVLAEAEANPEREALGLRHYCVLGIALLTVLLWLTGQLHGFSSGIVGLVPITLLFGLGLLGRADFQSLSWDVLFMLGGGLCLGVGLQASGLTEQIVQAIPTDPATAFVLFAVLGMLMTTFMSNTATANLLIPIAVSLEAHPALLAVTIAMVCSTSMALPVSTPPNAIAFGSGMLRAKDLVLPGLLITLLGLGLLLFVAPYYWRWIASFGA